MDERLSPIGRKQLDRFCRQYLQGQLDLNYPDDMYLRNDTFQQALHARISDENVIAHAPTPRYRIRVLKELIGRIEQSIQDWEEEVFATFLCILQHMIIQGISDDIMGYLSSLFASPVSSEATSAQRQSYVTFSISSLSPNGQDTPTIILLESRYLVAAAGTTGLRTWESALHLGNYLSTYGTNLVQAKSILELGAGTGYISILCAKYLGAGHVIATDGSDDVVASLSTNFYLNGLQDVTAVEGKKLKWGQALLGGEYPEWNGGRNIDLVLGADITYDGSEIPALLSTLSDLFEIYPKVKIIIASPVRNPTSLKAFLDGCLSNNYILEMINFEISAPQFQMGPFYSDKIPIQLTSITKAPTLVAGRKLF